MIADRPLVPVEEARTRILARIEPLPPKDLPLAEALGCVTAGDVLAPGDLPPFASSAMDGYAVRAADLTGAAADRPVALRVAGAVTMGRAPERRVREGEAISIPTGGPVPEGADAVVPIEGCRREDGRVLVLEATEPGRFVRPAGEDVRAGEVLVPAGRLLQAPDVGLLAAGGISAVPVHPRGRVVVVSTGDELVEVGQEAGPGQIHDANGATLAAALREAGAVPVSAGIVGDDPNALLERLAEHLGEADAFVSSGGVSVGEREPVKAAFAGRGEVDVYEVAMQPGKPQAFGAFEGRPFFGLPGNPASVYVSYEVFVRPALMRMMGRAEDRPEAVATLAGRIEGIPTKTRFARVRVHRSGGSLIAEPAGGHGSNLLGVASRAHGLAIIPPGPGLPAGASCPVILYREPW